jgi:nucleotide-binding universal stress UspA family protein
VTLLLLVDGRDTAELLRSLARFVRLDEARLVLVYVSGPGPRAGLELLRRRPGRPAPPPREQELDQAERVGGAEALEEALRLARPLARSVETLQLRGEPGRAVCELAAAEKAELVAVRASGRALGPTARFVSDHCPCPVLLLKAS